LMITIVLNSFFRSGSTIMMKVMELSNPDAIVLCEPFHEGVYSTLEQVTPRTPDALHGYPIWGGYFKIPKEILEKLARAHRKFRDELPLITNFTKVTDYLDILHSIKKEVMFKTTRSHFILSQMKRRYGCRILHLIRNPANTWMDFLHASIKYNDSLFWRVTTSNRLWNQIKGSFYLGGMYEKVRKMYDLPKARDNLSRFIMTWIMCNYAGIKASDFTIVYEAVLRRRRLYFNSINRVLGRVVFHPNYAHLPDERLALEMPMRRGMLNILITRRIMEYGLVDFYKEIFKVIRGTFAHLRVYNEYYPRI